MTIDVKTISIEPTRKTYDHLKRRFGDKPASRYQEASYDLQAAENLHYRPTWDPSQELYDPNLSKVKMTDWYAIRDPRQFYYHTYTITRARQQDTAEANFDFVESRGLGDLMPDDLRDTALALLVPLRHVAWAANQNNTLICGYGFGVTFTQPALYYAMDCLGIAQYLSRLGLLFGGPEALERGRSYWMEDAAWQPLRRFAEDSMAVRDPVEVFMAWNIALDGLLYPLIYEHIVDDVLAAKGAASVPMLTQFMTNWYTETQRFVDAALKVMATESDANREQLVQWFDAWNPRAADALEPIAAIALGETAADAVAVQCEALRARLGKLGLAV